MENAVIVRQNKVSKGYNAVKLLIVGAVLVVTALKIIKEESKPKKA